MMHIEYCLQTDNRPGHGRFLARPAGMAEQFHQSLTQRRRDSLAQRLRGLPTVEIVLVGDGPLIFDTNGNFGKDAPRRPLPSLPPGVDFITLQWDIKLLHVTVLRTLDARLVQQALSRLASQILNIKSVEVSFLDLRKNQEPITDLSAFLI